MNAISKTAEKGDVKMILSTLWIFATLNYIYADVFTVFFLPGAQASTTAMPAGAALAFSVLMETAIAMVLLSRILNYGVNRWANVIVGAVQTLAVLFFTFLGGTQPAAFSAFFAIIEIVCTLFIIWYAWKWPRSEA